MRWLTYSEAAAAMGVDRETVVRRARRRKWGKQPGNDGKPRVAVPLSVLPPISDTFPDITRPESPDALAFLALAERAARAEGAAAALREEGDRLRAWAEEQLKAATRRLDEERAASAAKVMGLWTAGEAARVQAAMTAAEVTALRGQVKAERARAELARDEAAAWVREAEAARNAARAELEEWERGGPIARALRAFLSRRARP